MSRTGTERPGPRVELLWFQDCPNHPAARVLLAELLGELAPGTAVHEIDASDPAVADRHRFPGSPTIRIDGRDVDPSYQDPGDYTPRCRLYRTADGLRGLPERAWVEAALRASLSSRGVRARVQWSAELDPALTPRLSGPAAAVAPPMVGKENEDFEHAVKAIVSGIRSLGLGGDAG